MRKQFIIYVLLTIVFSNISIAQAAEKRRLRLNHADSSRVHRDGEREFWYGYGDVSFRIDSTYVLAEDSVVWERHTDIIRFFGNVKAYDSIQYINGEMVTFYHADSLLIAEDNVVMIHLGDSIKSESQKARFDQKNKILYLESEPRLYLNYPDTLRIVKVSAVKMTFYSEEKRGVADSSVVIEYQDTRATCDRAEFATEEKILTLTENPYAIRGDSDIKGQKMQIAFRGDEIRQIDVFDDAEALFVEASDSLTGDFTGKSYLSAGRIRFYFMDDEIRKIDAIGAARSKYFPPPDDTTDAGQNFVSGDSISIFVENRKTTKIDIKGGAEGIYITRNKSEPTAPQVDSVSEDALSVKTDTLATSLNREDLMAVETLPDSSVIDSTAVQDSTCISNNIWTDSVLYQGDFLEFFAADRMLRMTGNSIIRQEDVVLTAGQVDYDIRNRVVMARAATDTLDDSTIVTPLSLRDSREEIFGTRLVFNVDTKKGLIEDATTKFERSNYFGEDLYKEKEQVFYVEDGRLTPCELDEANIFFKSKKMKLIQNDRVIARPVVMYIETIPVLALPYYVFPLKRGRHSGILPIKLGNFEQGNRFIGNLGYYWAASEYWDLQAALDFYENIGITINSLFRYNKRYAFSGSVRGSFSREREEYAFGESRRRRWNISGNHSQTLPYDIKFQASGTFVSDKNYYTDYSTNPDERRNRSVISKANFNKKFGRSSLSLSFNHTNNLDTDSRSSSLPSGSFTMPPFNPFGSGKEVDGVVVRKWYNQLYLGYSNRFAVYTQRSIKGDGSKTKKEYAYLDHSLSLKASQNVLKYLNINSSVATQETWYYILPTDQAYYNKIPAKRSYRRAAVSAGLSLGTNLYGTFPVGLLGLVALRHVLTPSIGYRWAPAITKNQLVRQYVGSGGGGSRQQSLSFTLTHLFKGKVKTDRIDRDYDILRISSSINHNFESLGRKFSDLQTSFSSSLVNNLSLSGSMIHDVYDDNNELQLTGPRLKSFSISSSLQARGSVYDDYLRQGLDADELADTTATGTGLDYNISEPPGMSKTSWNFSLSHRYSEAGLLTGSISRSHWLQFTFNIDLTKNWKIKYHQNYDMLNKATTEKVIDIYRKLPCWEGHFYWIPEGSRRGFYFKINVIAIPDIKFEKSESGLRGALLNK